MKVFDLSHCQKLMGLLVTKSRYICLLTSMHLEFLYRKDAHKVAGAGHFLKEQETLRKKLRKELKLNQEDAKKIYSFMEWFDACSLLLCQRQIPPEKRTVEISHGKDGTRYEMFQPTAESLSITPWPFETSLFTVGFEYRLIPNIQFADSRAFRKAFLAAHTYETVWQLKKALPVIQAKTK